MRSARLTFILVCALGTGSIRGQSTIEGRVELPKARSAPVVTKRYEIVTTGGVVSTYPPLAVVYLEDSVSPGKSTAPKQVAQKNLAFVPALLLVQVGSK